MKYKHTLLLDFDTNLFKKYEKKWSKIAKLVIEEIEGYKFIRYIKHKSLICKKCGRSWTDFPKNLKKYKKCKFCGAKKHNLKRGRGWHVFVHIASNKKLDDYSIIRLQWLCGSDEHKEMLGLKKAQKGVLFNKLFSQVIYRRPPSIHLKCKHCGYEIKTCPKCGKEIKQGCVNCGIRKGVQILLGKKHF